MRAPILFLLCVCFSLSAAHSEVPSVMPFQAVIRTSGGDIIPDRTDVAFSIWDSETTGSGSMLWGYETIEVTPVNGVVSVMLGETEPLGASVFDGASAYLSIKIGGTGGEELSRIPIGTTCFAFKAAEAEEAETLGGLGATDLAAAEHEHDADDLTSGTLSADRLPEITGDMLADETIETAALGAAAVTTTKIAAEGIEGQVLMIGTGGGSVEWGTPEGGGGGGVTSVETVANGGLENVGTASDVDLQVASSGVTSNMIAPDAVTTAKISPEGIEGQVLMIGTGGGSVEWGTPEGGGGGGITSVETVANGGLENVGTTSDVDLQIASGGVTSAMIQNATIVNADISSLADIDPSKVNGTAWTGNNDGTGSGLDADMVDGYSTGNQSNYIPISNGNRCANLNADQVDGKDADDFVETDDDWGRSGVAANLYEGSTALVSKYLGISATAANADKVDNFHAGNSSGQVAVSNGTLCANLNADLLDGQEASSFLSSTNDYGRSGVASALYEGTTALSSKYQGINATAGGDLTGTYPSPTIAPNKVVKSLNGIRDSVELVEGANISITEAGNDITIAATGGGDDGDWTIDGDNVYRASGKVGIGTSSPNWGLHAHTSVNQSVIQITNSTTGTGTWDGLTVGVMTSGYGVLQHGNGDLYLDAGETWGTISLKTSGRVGIGERYPDEKLQVGASGDGSRAIANEWALWTFSDGQRNGGLLDPVDSKRILAGLESANVGVYRAETGRAEQLLAIDLPEVVLAADGGSVNLGEYCAFLLAAIKVQQAQIEGLQTQVAELRTRVGIDE